MFNNSNNTKRKTICPRRLSVRENEPLNETFKCVLFLINTNETNHITLMQMDKHRSKRKSESDIVSDITGQPYSVSVLKEGYCTAEADGTFRADGTITLITGPQTILVDTGGPWDREFLLAKLKEKGLTPDSVAVVVGTHGHSDHVGNLGLFQDAKIIVGCDISVVDRYLPNQLAEGQPYPIDDHVSYTS